MSLEKVIREKLKTQGYKLTPQRARLIHILVQAKKPVTAKEVHLEARNNFPGISLETVYRTLKLLTYLGLASNSNISNREAEAFEIAAHHHHLVCLACGQVICLDSCHLDVNFILPQASGHSFQVVSHTLEFYGYCARCSA